MKRLIGLILISGALSACAANHQPDRTLNANVLSEQTAHTEVRFTPGSALIPPSEAARLAAFIDGLNPGAALHLVLIHQPAGGEMPRHLEETRYREVMKAVRDSGIDPERVNLAFAPSLPPAGDCPMVQVQVGYIHVQAPDCNQPEQFRDRYINAPVRNFGCSTNRNLGAMVADPMDMLRGSGDIQADEYGSVRAVSNYKGTGPSGPVAPPTPATAISTQ